MTLLSLMAACQSIRLPNVVLEICDDRSGWDATASGWNQQCDDRTHETNCSLMQVEHRAATNHSLTGLTLFCLSCCSSASNGFAASNNPYQQQSARSTGVVKATPLYAGLQSARTTRMRSRTPLPAPSRAVALRDAAREQFSKSASFPYDQPEPTLSMFANSAAAPASSKRAPTNTHRNGQFYQNAFAAGPIPVFDPVLPSPIVVVHGNAKNSFNKTNYERKHAGTSRNVLGGFYTS